MRNVFLCCAVAVLLTRQNVAANSIPSHISVAVADTTRPQADIQRDADRKPADVIAFAGLKPGDKVADFMPGRGYFTKIFCKAVGDAGRVYAISIPREPLAGVMPTSTPATQLPQEPVGGTCANVMPIALRGQHHWSPEKYSSSDDPGAVYEYWTATLPAENFTAPEPLDLIWTSENYHDLHNKSYGPPDMGMVGEAFLKSLKPGGVLIVEDHAAAARSGARDTETLHRIDPELVKTEMSAAGFVYVGESHVLRHLEDAHSTKAHETHDKTDRFLLKFRKP